MSIISSLAVIRKKKGLTQEQLSAVSGVSRVTIARFEVGRSNPTLETIRKLAHALRVPVNDLIDKKAG